MIKQFWVIILSPLLLAALAACARPTPTVVAPTSIPATLSPTAPPTPVETRATEDVGGYPASTSEPPPTSAETEPTGDLYPYPVVSSIPATAGTEPPGDLYPYPVESPAAGTPTPEPLPTGDAYPYPVASPTAVAPAPQITPTGDSYPYPLASPEATQTPAGTPPPGDSYPYPIESPSPSIPTDTPEASPPVGPATPSGPAPSPTTGSPEPSPGTGTASPPAVTLAIPSPSPPTPAAPRPAQRPALALPITTSAGIVFKGWSPDARYLAFLSQTRLERVEASEAEIGTMHFYNVENGEHCQYPRNNQQRLNFTGWFGWLPDGKLAVLTRPSGSPAAGATGGNLVVLDAPCAKESAASLPALDGAIEEVLLGSADGGLLLLRGEDGCLLYDVSGAATVPLRRCAQNASFSPTGDRLAINVHQRGSNYSTLVFNTSTGRVARSVDWMFPGEPGELPEPVWLGDRRFLITRTDAGPQLVTLGADFNVQAIADTLFGLPGSPDQVAEGIFLPDGNTFHILLMDTRPAASSGNRGSWLYHSESQLVETLPYASAGFSPGRRYLDLVKRLVVNETDELEHWLRNVDPGDSTAIRLTSTEDQDFPSLSPDGRGAIARIAEPGAPTTLIVKSVAGGEVLQAWFVDPYTYNFYWSPNGMVLAAFGDGRPGREQALYLFSTPGS